MSLYSENFNIELLRDIFRTHPMWNYNFYLIIESDPEKNLEPIGIGFKNIKILDKTNNEFLNIDNAEIQSIISNQKYNSELICENGMTHDGSTHKFIDDINSGMNIKRDILIMEIEKSEGEFKDRIEKSNATITSVKRAWILENTYPINWETSGFDAMSNEIFIQKIQFKTDDIKVIEMTEEIAKEKARTVVSKLF